MSKIGDLFYEVIYNINDTGLKRVEKDIESMGRSANDSSKSIGILDVGIGNLVKTGVQILSVGYAFSKTKDLIINATDAYGKFDDSLRKTGAKIGATEQELRLLGDSTKKVALEMNSTAVAVSDAQEFLALAGYTLEEIQAASPTVVAAQKATGESMQLVSDIATDTASSYGYMAAELDYVTDRMVYTTNKFNTNFAQLGEAMKYVAPIANQTGMEFSDLNSYLGVLANSGIKGSQAGTALRQSFLRLQAPTGIASKLLKRYRVDLYNTKGEFVGVNEAMLKIEKATQKMTEKQRAFFLQQLFGTEAMSSINILFKEGIQNVMEYGNSIDMADGKTKEMAKFMEAGFGGMKRSLESQKDGIMVVLGEIFEPVAWDFVKILRDGASEIREGLEDNKSDFSLATSGLWSFTKKAGGVVGDFIYNTGEILDFATGGLFTNAPEVLVSGAANALIEEGKEAQSLQEVEKRRMILSNSGSLLNINELDLKNYINTIHQNNEELVDIITFLKTLDLGYSQQSDYKLGENFSEDKLREKYIKILNQEELERDIPYGLNLVFDKKNSLNDLKINKYLENDHLVSQLDETLKLEPSILNLKIETQDNLAEISNRIDSIYSDEKKEIYIEPIQKWEYKFFQNFSEKELKEKYLDILADTNENNNTENTFNINLNLGNINLENGNNNDKLIEFLGSKEAKLELESIFNNFLNKNIKKVRNNY